MSNEVEKIPSVEISPTKLGLMKALIYGRKTGSYYVERTIKAWSDSKPAERALMLQTAWELRVALDSVFDSIFRLELSAQNAVKEMQRQIDTERAEKARVEALLASNKAIASQFLTIDDDIVWLVSKARELTFNKNTASFTLTAHDWVNCPFDSLLTKAVVESKTRVLCELKARKA